jgi:hypothetical protein
LHRYSERVVVVVVTFMVAKLERVVVVVTFMVAKLELLLL